ncbi:hypothetical protein [Halocatena pleomorpha]|uniref:Uncharacterized protein n=1 Tax=Halocatena pleomorpha TaxID=1785090 RepID=A0A3P3RL43_9EURY|nr:hypothetical protein [Halocatena pleomorpha]RRJ33529.1 hypothetical protein EIK79_01635 [Halocatena pleomorpha]
MRTAESEAVIAEAAGVTVEKRFEPDEFPVPAIAFTISSKRDDPITLRMHDTLPDEVNSDHIGLHPEYGGEYWSVEENSAVFKRSFDPNEEYVTVYGLRHIYVDTADQFLVEPEIEILDPATDILGENSGQHVREVIAGESDDVRSPEPNAGSTRGGTSVRPGGRSGEQPQPSAPTMDSIGEALAEEIRNGTIDDQALETLQENLTIEPRQPSRSHRQRGGGTKGDSSMDARIRRLQADVGDLRAYTDALEGFLDENGEAQVMLSDFRQELDDLNPRVNSLETQTNEMSGELSNAIDDFSNDIGALSSDIDSLTTEIDSLNDYADSLSDDLSTLESDLESISSDVSRLQSRVRRLDNSTATEEDLEQIQSELDSLATFRQRMQSVFDG